MSLIEWEHDFPSEDAFAHGWYSVIAHILDG